MGASIVGGEGNLASYPGRSLKKKINGRDTRLRVTRNAAFLDMYNVQKYNIELYLNARLFICLYIVLLCTCLGVLCLLVYARVLPMLVNYLLLSCVPAPNLQSKCRAHT